MISGDGRVGLLELRAGGRRRRSTSSGPSAMAARNVLAVGRVDEPVLGAPHEERRRLHPVEPLAEALVRERPDELQDAGHRHRRLEQRLGVGRVGRRQRPRPAGRRVGEQQRRAAARRARRRCRRPGGRRATGRSARSARAGSTRSGLVAAISAATMPPNECPTSVGRLDAEHVEQLVVVEDEVPQVLDVLEALRLARAGVLGRDHTVSWRPARRAAGPRTGRRRRAGRRAGRPRPPVSTRILNCRRAARRSIRQVVAMTDSPRRSRSSGATGCVLAGALRPPLVLPALVGPQVADLGHDLLGEQRDVLLGQLVGHRADLQQRDAGCRPAGPWHASIRRSATVVRAAGDDEAVVDQRLPVLLHRRAPWRSRRAGSS